MGICLKLSDDVIYEQPLIIMKRNVMMVLMLFWK